MIFGSTAAKHWFSDFRDPKDVDIISRESVMTPSEQHYWVDAFSMIPAGEYCPPDHLYTIKCAHANWNIWWDKTMTDILFFKRKGCTLITDFYDALVKDFIQIHGKAWASLEGKNAESFFVDAVTRKYVHDDIHEAVAYYDKPLYFRILKDPESGSVGCSEDKFMQLSDIDKARCVKEEIFVTALERYLIPFDFKYSRGLAYQRSLKKLVTTMSSGWFSRWMIDNFGLLTPNTDWEFIEKFKQAEKENKLRMDTK